MNAVVLEVQGLHKAYGAIVVSDDVSFTLAQGQCLGLIESVIVYRPAVLRGCLWLIPLL